MILSRTVLTVGGRKETKGMTIIIYQTADSRK
jgi:hypothetical protein